MRLTVMILALGIELSDTGQVIFTDAILTRAITKSVSLMSRLIPKRNIVEATLNRTITDEALTIASSTGTTAYKPIKDGTISIDGKTLDTDYRVNYLTGVVTEIGALLTDGAYVCDYKLDPQVFDLSTLLTTDYIKIERVECPVGESPRTNVPFDLVGCYLVFGGDVTLTTNKHIRITYLEPWTAPGAADGDYPVHLDSAVIVGSAGQALIFRAEALVQLAVTDVEAATTALGAISAVTMASAPDITTETGAATTALTAAAARFAAAVSTIASMNTPLGSASSAAALVATETTLGNIYLDSGTPYIIKINDAERVAEKYAAYAQAEAVLGQTYGRQAEQYVAIALGWEASAARDTAIGNGYVNEATQRLAGAARLIEKYQQELIGDATEVNYYRSQVEKAIGYQTTAAQYLETAGRYLASGQAKINEMLIMLGLKSEYHMYKSSSEQFS